MTHELFEELQSDVRRRVILVLLLVHAGLALALYGHLSSQALPLLSGIALLYGGFVVGAIFVLRPILRARHAKNWLEEFERHLPVILESLPKVIAVVQEFRAAWDEGKRSVHREHLHKAQ